MSFIREHYDESMGSLTQMLKHYRQISDPHQYELLLGDLWSENSQAGANTRSWSLFRSLCRRLEEAGAVSVVVRFLWGVFHCSDCYDRARFQKELSSIALNPDLNLADLCRDAFLAYAEQTGDIMLQNLDPYQDGPASNDSLSCRSPGDLTKLLPVFLAEKLYNISFQLDTMTTEDVDRLAQAIIERTRLQAEAENSQVISYNLARAEKEAQARQRTGKEVHFSRKPQKTRTEFDQCYAIAGGLLELYRACELTGREDICYHILEHHVWPVFAKAPWEASRSERIQILAGLAGAYADAMFSQLLGTNSVLTNRWLSRTDYSEEQFFSELTGQAEGAILRGGKQRYAGHGQLAQAMRLTLQKGKDVLKHNMEDYLYSFLMAVTPYMLLSTDQQDDAADFLVRHYDEISLYDKRLLYVQILLTRSILSTKQLDMAYTLYGSYTHEMDRKERDRDHIGQAVRDILLLLRNAQEHIRQCNQHTFDTGCSWYDLLFGDGKIDLLLEEIEAGLDAGRVPDEQQFRTLLRIVEAFSYPTGIRLPLLNIPNQDGYDKLENALSREMILQGQGYIDHRDDYFAFYHSISQQEIRRNVDTILQHHISQLVQQTLKDSLDRVEQIRQSLQADHDGNEEIMNKLEAVYRDLSNRLQKGFLGRPEVERHIDVMEQTFRAKYCPNYQGRSLLSKLPKKLEQEIRNYLVTGEIVYRLLSSREDADSLDFSAALIPLTKAVEQILNLIYRSMNVWPFPGLDSKVKQSYFNYSDEKKASIEFGPGILLFKDSKYINVKYGSNSCWLQPHEPYQESHFKRWDGNRVVDIAALRNLGAGRNKMSLRVDGWDRITRQPCTVNIFFTQDDNENRMLLAQGLDYIRVHHRNIVAHKDPVARTMVEECRDILLMTEDILWILLYILK